MNDVDVPAHLGVVLKLYPDQDYANGFQASAMVFTDMYMVEILVASTQQLTSYLSQACPSKRGARWFTALQNTSVYVYHFVHQLEALKVIAPQEGVMHARFWPKTASRISPQ